MFARTKRLTLRPGWPEDAPALAAAIGHRQVVRNLGLAPWPYGVADAAAFLALPRSGHEPRFLMFDSIDRGPRLVGGIDIHDEPGVGPEIGYWLTPTAWGQGYATEAGRAVLHMARHALGLKRLHAVHFVDNPASGRVLAKLGFRSTGRIEPRPSLGRGGAVQSAVYDLDLDADRAEPLPLAA